MKIHESAENYLETILILSRQQPHVRSIDIAAELNFSKPSVSVAMKNLRKNGYILVDKDGYIALTEAGLKIADYVGRRPKNSRGGRMQNRACDQRGELCGYQKTHEQGSIRSSLTCPAFLF